MPILAVALAGILLALWLPFLGHLIQHAFGHATAHVLDHHESGFAVALACLFWSLLIGIVGTAASGFWWPCADAILAMLILFRLFGAGH